MVFLLLWASERAREWGERERGREVHARASAQAEHPANLSQGGMAFLIPFGLVGWMGFHEVRDRELLQLFPCWVRVFFLHLVG